MKAWMLHLKRTLRVDDLEPSKWFQEQFAKWEKLLVSWRRTQNDARDAAGRKLKEVKAEDESKELDEDADLDTIPDVNDVGNGKPLYLNFVYEDWVLLSLRFELHLLCHAFKRELDDPDRPGFTETHLAYYYSKYYKKSFDLKWYNVKDL